MQTAGFIMGIIVMTASAMIAVKFWSGEFIFLVAKSEQTEDGTPFFSEKAYKAAQRAAWVMVACFAVAATLLAFGMSEMTGNLLFIQITTILNNIALIAFCGCVVWALYTGYKDQGTNVRFLDTMGRQAGTMLVCCVVLTVLSLLFA